MFYERPSLLAYRDFTWLFPGDADYHQQNSLSRRQK